MPNPPPSNSSQQPTQYPAFADLPRPDETGLPLAWGVWGAADQVGTLNHITPAVVQAAAAEIRKGQRFNLDLPLHVPYALCTPGGHRFRREPEHSILTINATGGLPGHDDKLDKFYLQCSSQWDGLTHIGDPRHGFYNGVQEDQITGQDGTRNGIENMADFGIVTRAVLADLPRYFAKVGRTWDPNTQQVVTPAELDACLADVGVTVRPGDVLLVRLGWTAHYLGASVAERDDVFKRRAFSGLSGGADMWEWIWERRVAAVAADTPTAEVWPLYEGKPSLHLAIARLGLTLGEMFALDDLAEDCAADGRYTCFFTSSPLALRGGVGSPPNAIAVK